MNSQRHPYRIIASIDGPEGVVLHRYRVSGHFNDVARQADAMCETAARARGVDPSRVDWVWERAYDGE